MKIVDLTQTLENGMSVYPGAPEPIFEQVGNVKKGDIYQLTKFAMTTHTGTHLDCNTHVQPEGYYADTEELDLFIGKGIVIDCSRYGSGEEIGMEVFEGINMSDKEFVLIYCDWAKLWGKEEFWGDYPYLSMEVIEYLADNSTIKGLGVEYAAIDRLPDTELPLHKRLMQNRKTIIENLANLDKLMGKDFTFMSLPLKLKNGDGSPVRAIAVLNS